MYMHTCTCMHVHVCITGTCTMYMYAFCPCELCGAVTRMVGGGRSLNNLRHFDCPGLLSLLVL